MSLLQLPSSRKIVIFVHNELKNEENSVTFGEMPQRLKSMFFKISAKRMDTQSEFFSSKLYVDFSLWGNHPKKHFKLYNFSRISAHSFMMIE